MEEQPDRIRVLVADEREQYLEPISNAIEALGHEVVRRETEIRSVGQASIDLLPDIAIVALHEDTEHALDLISEIVDEATCPVMVLAPEASTEFVAAAAARGVFAHLDSTEEVELQGAIEVTLQRYRQYRDLLLAFDRRARIERAKGILMERHAIGDQEAFDRVRREARDARRPLIEVVDDLLAEGGSSFAPPDRG